MFLWVYSYLPSYSLNSLQAEYFVNKSTLILIDFTFKIYGLFQDKCLSTAKY